MSSIHIPSKLTVMQGIRASNRRLRGSSPSGRGGRRKNHYRIKICLRASSGWHFDEQTDGNNLPTVTTLHSQSSRDSCDALPGYIELGRDQPEHTASVGWVMHAHGTKGEVRVRPHTDEPEARLATVRAPPTCIHFVITLPAHRSVALANWSCIIAISDSQ